MQHVYIYIYIIHTIIIIILFYNPYKQTNGTAWGYIHRDGKNCTGTIEIAQTEEWVLNECGVFAKYTHSGGVLVSYDYYFEAVCMPYAFLAAATNLPICNSMYNSHSQSNAPTTTTKSPTTKNPTKVPTTTNPTTAPSIHPAKFTTRRPTDVSDDYLLTDLGEDYPSTVAIDNDFSARETSSETMVIAVVVVSVVIIICIVIFIIFIKVKNKESDKPAVPNFKNKNIIKSTSGKDIDVDQIGEGEEEGMNFIDNLQFEGVPLNNDYIHWDYMQILQWILSLDNGYFMKYKDVLKESLKEDEMTGEQLENVEMTDIKIWGIKTFKDRHRLFEFIKQLRNIGDADPMTYM